MNWPVVGWPTQSEFRPSARPNRSPRSDNVRAALGWPGEPQANTGLRWRSIKSPSDNFYRSICWSPELKLFCAVASSGTGDRVITSPDGLNWNTQLNAAVDDSWYSVCWSSKLRLFCAVSNSGKIMLSSNGIGWTYINPGITAAFTSVCWAESLNLFCAVGNSGSGRDVATSVDGSTWTTQADATFTFGFSSVCWSEELNLFCATIPGLSRVNTSPNGVNWTSLTTSAAFNSVAWSKKIGCFFAGGSAGNVNVSFDGTTWSNLFYLTSLAPANILGVCDTGSLSSIIAVGTGSYTALWKGYGNMDAGFSPLIPATNSYSAVCYSPELRRLVAVARTGTGNRIMVSP